MKIIGDPKYFCSVGYFNLHLMYKQTKQKGKHKNTQAHIPLITRAMASLSIM